MEEMRINKYIALCGICSRRAADELINLGKVKINDKVVTELGSKVNNTDIIKINDKIINLEKQKIYVILNKPKGYVTTSKEQFKRKSILDLVPLKERIYPVGRLDMYSEGLIILTNDGAFANKVMHPSNHIAKTYLVTLNKEIEKSHVTRLENGIDIGEHITSKAIVKKLNKNTIEIIIFEGKNRQIRRMCEAIGYKVLNLKRVAIGKVTLGNLKSGEYKKTTYDDIKLVFE